MNWTETDILGKGRVPDGKGGWKLPGLSEHDFDNGGVESGHAGASIIGLPRPVADSRPATNSGGSVPPVVNPSNPAIRIPRPRIPNATEARYGDILRVRYQEHDVLYESISFRLACGSFYTCDWTVWDSNALLEAWEVKGSYRFHSQSRSVLAWRQAAVEWPTVSFGWASWRGGNWQETIIPRSKKMMPAKEESPR